MSKSKQPICALSELHRIDPAFARMISEARSEAQARVRQAPSTHVAPPVPEDGTRQCSRHMPVVPRVYIAEEWPAPSCRSAAQVAKEGRSFMASPRPRSDYVNGATLVRAFIANEGLQGNSVRAGRAQALQYFIDSAFWVGKAVAWPHSRPPMMEAYWLRMPISRVSSIELEPFIQANLDIWSAQVVKQHMAILDLSLKAAQEHGANVRFRLVKQLQAALAVRPDDRHAA